MVTEDGDGQRRRLLEAVVTTLIRRLSLWFRRRRCEERWKSWRSVAEEREEEEEEEEEEENLHRGEGGVRDGCCAVGEDLGL